MRQFEIRWANLPMPIGRRPVLLLSRTPAYQYLAKVMIAEISSTIRGIPQEVSIGRREGVRRPSVINLDNCHVVPKALLGDLLGSLGDARHRELKRALGYALAWPELQVL